MVIGINRVQMLVVRGLMKGKRSVDKNCETALYDIQDFTSNCQIQIIVHNVKLVT